MSSQHLLKSRLKEVEFTAVNGLDLLIPGMVNGLDPGLQAAVVVGKSLGYIPDRNSQRCVLQHLGSFTFTKLDWEVLKGMTPTTFVSCTLSARQIV
jgi:proteasome assembly chaperone (PAC2) family protein